MAYCNKCKQWTMSKPLVIFMFCVVHEGTLGWSTCSLCLQFHVHGSSSYIFIIIGFYFYYSIMFLVIDVYWYTSVVLFFCIILVLFITDHLFKWPPANEKVVLNCIVCLQNQYTCNIIATMKHSFIELRQLKQPENLSVQIFFQLWVVLNSLACEADSQLAKKFPAFYRIWRFITVFTIACHQTLSEEMYWARVIHTFYFLFNRKQLDRATTVWLRWAILLPHLPLELSSCYPCKSCA